MNLLPRPQSISKQAGTFAFDHELAVSGPLPWAAIIRRLLSPGTGRALPSAADGALKIINDGTLPAEAYQLEVTDTGITVAASDDRGVNWAGQTLRQLLGPDAFRPAPIKSDFSVPCLTIKDAPRFSWRGVMLDVGRHFFPLTDLFTFIDLAAMHKYNTFHLHLTDDQGWRFESLRHPELNTIASWRTETQNPEWPIGDGTPHGGLYRQDQLRSLVAYAADRGITIVPEIEFPGHVMAVLSALPELGNNPGKPIATATTWGIKDQVLNMSDDALAVVFDLYEELLDVFPSSHIHVGGDECERIEWHRSRSVRQLAEAHGLADVDQLQRWFTEMMRDWLAERDRRLVGWDEICADGALEGAVAMAWRGTSHGIKAAEAGMEVVMAPMSHTYFDFYPSAAAEEPYSIGGLISTEHAYSFEPLAGIAPQAWDRVLGTQCQIWT